jgi:hypothetical protein
LRAQRRAHGFVGFSAYPLCAVQKAQQGILKAGATNKSDGISTLLRFKRYGQRRPARGLDQGANRLKNVRSVPALAQPSEDLDKGRFDLPPFGRQWWQFAQSRAQSPQADTQLVDVVIGHTAGRDFARIPQYLGHARVQHGTSQSAEARLVGDPRWERSGRGTIQIA